MDEGTALRVWHGFDRATALGWTRVLRVHWPTWPGPEALMAVTAGLAAGTPAALPAWAERARVAERAGFDPALYDRLQLALDAVPAFAHAAHPDNDPDPRWPVHTIRAFDPAAWRDWPWLVAAGWRDQEAVRLLLAAASLS